MDSTAFLQHIGYRLEFLLAGHLEISSVCIGWELGM